MPNNKYDWKAIQRFYDGGQSLRGAQAKFGFSNTAYQKASKRGDFIGRKIIASGRIRQRFSSTTRKGEIACLKFDLRAIERGFIVSTPITEVVYDRVLDDGQKLWKVQVKHARLSKNGTYEVGLARQVIRTTNKASLLYDDSIIDAVVAYLPDFDIICWFSPKMFNRKTRIHVRTEPTKNSQEKGIIWYQKFVW